MNVLSIPEAASKYGVNEKKLRGAVWLDNQTGRLDLPMGESSTDRVQDDAFLRAWVAKQRGLGVR